MKSVIAQGATISKAIDDALNKAGKPQEFFVKILEEGQAGFLGFGSKKAKIALFFKKDDYSRRDSEVLPQAAYRDLFNNNALDKQLGAEKQDQKADSKPQFKQKSQENRRFQRRQLGSDAAREQQSAQENRVKTEAPRQQDSKKQGYAARRRPSEQQQPAKQDDNNQERGDVQQRNSARPRRRRRPGSSSWGANRNNAKKSDKPKD